MMRITPADGDAIELTLALILTGSIIFVSDSICPLGLGQIFGR